MNCDEAKPFIFRYVNGTLGPAGIRCLKEHLRKCKECKKAFYSAKAIHKALSSPESVKSQEGPYDPKNQPINSHADDARVDLSFLNIPKENDKDDEVDLSFLKDSEAEQHGIDGEEDFIAFDPDADAELESYADVDEIIEGEDSDADIDGMIEDMEVETSPDKAKPDVASDIEKALDFVLIEPEIEDAPDENDEAYLTQIFDMGIRPGEFEEISPDLGDADPPVKGRSNMPFLILLLMVILGAGIYGLYTQRETEIVQKLLLHVPFIGNLLPPQDRDIGGVIVVKSEVKSRFVENYESEKLLVITGQVRNETAVPRKLVKIRANIYANGGIVAKETAYCGNLLTDSDLSHTAPAIIKDRLSTPAASKSIEPGEGAKFMIVFFEVPDNMEEFTLEITGSL